MLLYPRPSAGSTVLVHPLFIISSLLFSFPTANALCATDSNDDVACARSTSQTKSGVSTIAIVCIVGSAVFSLAIGSIFLYFYQRRRREHKEHGEHHTMTWEFRDRERSRVRPTLKSEGKSGANIQISYPVLMHEATTSPRYPTRAFQW